jgi:DNA-binding beta-propeller fold protein YncE
MSVMTGKRISLATICAAVLVIGAIGAIPAQAAEPKNPANPLFIFRPLRPEDAENPPTVPPVGDFEGPCGLAVTSTGSFLVSDYHHDAIHIFGAAKAYGGSIQEFEPLDGPCAVSLDAADALYVNNYHRSIVKITNFPFGGPPVSTVITGAGVDAEHPTGVAVNRATGTVYVNDRTHLASFDTTGAPLGQIGVGQIGDSQGLAVSEFPGTKGRLYVPDASTDTIKVFDLATSTVNPAATIDGHDTPEGKFISLRDSAIAVDRVSGEIYVVDDLQPTDTERAEAAIYVFDSAGVYKGRLKYNIIDAKPPGLAVDNSETLTQGRVYVTTENSERAAVFAYPPGAATNVALPALPLPDQQTGEIEEEPWAGEEEEDSFAPIAPMSLTATAAAPATQAIASAAAKPAKRHSRHRRKAYRHGTRTSKNHQAKRGRQG